MALFAVNSGCRDREIGNLSWDWEITVEPLGTSVFIISGGRIKNGEDRLVVLNGTAHGVIEACRGRQATHVFTYEGRPVDRMLTAAWKRARLRADLRHGTHAEGTQTNELPYQPILLSRKSLVAGPGLEPGTYGL